MSVVFLDESRTRCQQLSAALEKGKRPVVICSNSNDFINRINASLPEKLFIDLESWNKGRIIYSRFKIGRKLAEVPVVFYNASESFSAIEGRPKNSRDEILPASAPIEDVIEMARKVI